ncbi:MAG: helix-turn-helix transcriptional regulator [Bacilli bacterium]|nr:helix-turn-helix transcriptional regulator [Bacilli bacterium]
MFSNELVCNILDYINKNINKEITIDELSNIFYYDKTYIMKRFKKELSITIFDYINSMRVFNSLTLYSFDNYIIYIAFKSGFNSLEYYSEMFKKIMGVSPSIYRKYVNRDISIKDKEIDLILYNIVKLNRIKKMTDKYLNNRKPSIIMVKKIALK